MTASVPCRSVGACARKAMLGLVLAAGASIGGMAFAAACLAGPASANPVPAVTPSGPGLSLNATRAAGSRSPIELAATLTTAQGSTGPSANPSPVKVTFYVVADQFASKPLAELGSAVIGSTGEATFAYQPTWVGQQSFVAKAGASGQALSARTTFVAPTASDPAAAGPQAFRPDGSIGRFVVLALLLIVGAVWFTLVASVVRVALVMREGRP